MILLTPQPKRPAFTLLELLIAASITSVLLVGVWNMCATQKKLLDKGHLRAENIQLVRSLNHQFHDDLQAVVGSSQRERKAISKEVGFSHFETNFATESDSMDKLDMGGPSSAEFVGTKTSLKFNFVRCLRNLSNSCENNRSSTSPRAPELACVNYVFRASDARALDDEPSGQLVRTVVPREFDVPSKLTSHHLTLNEDSAENLSNRWYENSLVNRVFFMGNSNDYADTTSRHDSTHGGDRRLSVGRHTVDHIPEVHRLEFRYFDGHQWNDRWRGARLPVAIEVRFDLKSTNGRQMTAPEKARLPATADVPLTHYPKDSASVIERLRWQPQFRFVFTVGSGAIPLLKTADGTATRLDTEKENFPDET